MVEKLEQQIQPEPESPRRVRSCPECGGPRLMRDYDAAEVYIKVARKVFDARQTELWCRPLAENYECE